MAKVAPVLFEELARAARTCAECSGELIRWGKGNGSTAYFAAINFKELLHGLAKTAPLLKRGRAALPAYAPSEVESFGGLTADTYCQLAVDIGSHIAKVVAILNGRQWMANPDPDDPAWPWSAAIDDGVDEFRWEAYVQHVLAELPGFDHRRLVALIENECRFASQDRAEANVIHAKRYKPGRRKADFETEQRENKLAAEWKRAYSAGGYKAQFAKDKGLSLKQFDALLGRVRKRKARADK